MTFRGTGLVVALVALLMGGCAAWRPPVVPMQTSVDAAGCVRAAETLLVLLPGSGSTPQEWTREGFIDTVRAQGIAADILIADAHMGYYADASIIARLEADVVRPARAAGYRDIWFAGISVGAFGALIYADSHPEAVRGVLAIAPYLGTRTTVNEIRRSGGLMRWVPPPDWVKESGPSSDIDRLLWRHLQRQARAHGSLYLGFGTSDRFAVSHELLADALPRDHVFTTEGGHDWPAWRALWPRLLNAAPLPRDVSCVRGVGVAK